VGRGSENFHFFGRVRRVDGGVGVGVVVVEVEGVRKFAFWGQ